MTPLSPPIEAHWDAEITERGKIRLRFYYDAAKQVIAADIVMAPGVARNVAEAILYLLTPANEPEGRGSAARVSPFLRPLRPCRFMPDE